MKTTLSILIVTMTSILLTSFKASESINNPTGKSAWIVTWQNKAGGWYAAGPSQSLQTTCDSEEKAIELVGALYRKGDDVVRHIGCDSGKYRVWRRNRDLEDYENNKNVIREAGNICSAN
jgi:hypothetical protein